MATVVTKLVKGYGWNPGDQVEVLGKNRGYWEVKHVQTKEDGKEIVTTWNARPSSLEPFDASAFEPKPEPAQAQAAAG